MRLPITPEFEDECRRYAFAWSCEECAHFDETTERCRHEYPTDDHRQPKGEIVFCKEFELR